MPRASSSQRRSSVTIWGTIGACIIIVTFLTCVLTLPYTAGREAPHGPRRFEMTDTSRALLPPFWATGDNQASAAGYLLGSDRLGRSVLIRCLAGGGISLTIGLCAALIAVGIGTVYGATAGSAGGRIDAAMMRMVDVLYGLPYILLVVLIAVAVNGLVERVGADLGTGVRQIINIATLLAAIGAVSWLSMARVIRGQVLSLRRRPFMDACRVIGVSRRRAFTHHLLPNLIGPIIVYATLAAPQAILGESFLSFLGIGVREPLPSWGNLAADGLSELNVVQSHWWLLLWPCVFIAVTLISLNLVGEWLRDRLDPQRSAVR